MKKELKKIGWSPKTKGLFNNMIIKHIAKMLINVEPRKQD